MYALKSVNPEIRVIGIKYDRDAIKKSTNKLSFE